MQKKINPSVSFIIPTFNSQEYLKDCLESIIKQDYPKGEYEILVVDGNSTDNTRQIAAEYKVRVIHNSQKDPETAKSLGIQNAKGEIIVLLDSDNEIIKKDWLSKMVKPLLVDPQLFGVESFYFPKKGESIFNTYSMIAHIADPFSRCLAGRLKEQKKEGYIEYTVPKGSIYPLGANGFLWNRRIIEEIGLYKPKFEESNFAYFVMERGYRKFARVPDYGIYHQHISSIFDYIQKRLKIGNKYLNRKDEGKKTWLEGVNPLKFFMCIIYCSTFVCPLIEGSYNFIKTGQKAWLLHPFMSFVSVATYGVVFLQRRIEFFKKYGLY